MTISKALIGALALIAIAGCGKNNDNPVTHIGDEADKAAQETQLRSAKWVSFCDTTNIGLDLLGVKAHNTVYDFTSGDAGRIVQYFSTADCLQANLVLQVAYKGSQDVGVAAANNTARTLDLNYAQATVTVQNAELVASLNGGVAVLQNCGINTWVAGAGQPIPQDKAGGTDCLAVAKIPYQSFDIVHSDGSSMVLGDKSTGDGSTQDKRPTALDNNHKFSQFHP